MRTHSISSCRLELILFSFLKTIYADEVFAHFGLGIVLASVLFMKRSSDLAEQGTAVTALAGVDGERPWQDEVSLYEEYKDRIYIKHLYGPMFFGFTSHFQDLVRNLDEDIRALIIRMDRVPHIDQSGLYALEDAILDLRRKDGLVLLTGLQPQPYDMLRTIDIVPDLVPEEQIFEEFQDSIVWLRDELANGKETPPQAQREEVLVAS